MNLKKINDKFEIELGKEANENNSKEKEIKPSENDNWGSVNDLGFWYIKRQFIFSNFKKCI